MSSPECHKSGTLPLPPQRQDGGGDLPRALAGGAVLQVDQAASADQDFHRDERERRDEPGLRGDDHLPLALVPEVLLSLAAYALRSRQAHRGESVRPRGHSIVARQADRPAEGSPRTAYA